MAETQAEELKAAEARRTAGAWKAARWARRASQIVAFAVFVYLLFSAIQRQTGYSQTSFFIRADPLAALASMLSAREWLGAFVAAIVTLAVTVVLGRVWCGWVCPLGSLLGWLRFRGARRAALRVSPAFRRVKYVLLGVIVVMAALGSLTLLVFDPITLLTRTATTSILPAFVYAFNGVEQWAMGWTASSNVVVWLEDHLRGTWLPLTQPRYSQAVGLFLVLLTIVLLNAVADRFWCRYLCPLGALLGLVSKVQVLRPLAGARCDACGACTTACRMQAIEAHAMASQDVGGAASRAAIAEAHGTSPGRDEEGEGRVRVVTSECVMCLDCLVACRRPAGMTIGIASRPGPWATYDPGRRDALVALGGGLGAVALLGTGVWRVIPRPGLVRPPGAQDERQFLSRCLRCGECMKVCPTSGLQPSLTQAGLEGFWTPVLASRLGYCDYSCAACGEVCPSGAIPRLSLDEKRKQVLGVAVIDRDHCLPWAADTPCSVCQEMCPVPKKAIVFAGERVVTGPEGDRITVLRPKVEAKRCIGCGICENKCPLRGAAAISIVPANPDLNSGALTIG